MTTPEIVISFRWFDFWVGLYYDRAAKVLYLCPLPRSQLIFADIPAWKNIENRDWPTHFRGLVAIHTSKLVDSLELDAAIALTEQRRIQIEIPTIEELRLGAGTILGTVEIVDCVQRSNSPWFVGDYGFVLANPRRLAAPLPCRGMLGFWDVPDLISQKIKEQLAIL